MRRVLSHPKLAHPEAVCVVLGNPMTATNRPANLLVILALATLPILGTGSIDLASSATIDPGLLTEMRERPAGPLETIMVFDSPLTDTDVDALAGLGALAVRTYRDWGLAYVLGDADALTDASHLPGAVRLTENLPITFYGGMAPVTTRAREAWDAKSTSTSPVMVGGNVVDGSGVTIAVVDSGIYGLHPDLAPAIDRNMKFLCTTPLLVNTATDTCFGDALIGDIAFGPVYDGCTDEFWLDTMDSDSTSGHGTHVAGIAAGRGVASDGRIMGSAPGARLVGLGIGEVDRILYVLEAFNWIDCNKAAFDIEIVTNSWGVNAAFSAGDPVNIAVDDLVGDGVVVLFAAGNDGGSGTADRVNTYARNPTAGVISVANYNDLGTGDRSNVLALSSSRCLVGSGGVVVDADNCADVAAPGTDIASTVDPVGLIPPGELYSMPYYGLASGTSMATPHVAGIVALLKQADPTLTPADVEDILEDNALQFTIGGGYPASSDPSNPTNGINFGAGHGLVDAIASLEDSRVLGGSLGSPLPTVAPGTQAFWQRVGPTLVAGAPPLFHAQVLAVTGEPVVLDERSLSSGEPTLWPLTLGGAANYRIEDASATVTNIPTTLTVDGGKLRMAATKVFTTPGDYVVEAQINFGGTLVSFDSFVVRVVA